MQDYMGNIDGVSPFGITTQSLANTDKDKKSHLFYENMTKRKLATQDTSRSRLRSTKYNLTPKGKEAVEEMRRCRLLQHMIIKRFDAVITPLESEIAQLEKLSPPISVGKQGLDEMKEKLVGLKQVRGEIAEANHLAMDHIIMDLHGDIEFTRPIVDASGNPQVGPNQFGLNVGQFSSALEAQGAQLLTPVDPKVEGMTSASQRALDEKQFDYVDRVANQIASDVEKSISYANRPQSPLRHLPVIGEHFNQPHQSSAADKMFAAATGAQLFDLLSGEKITESLDPIRRRKIAFMQSRGIRQMPQADPGVDLLLYTARQKDNSPVTCRKFQNASPEAQKLLSEVLQDFKNTGTQDGIPSNSLSEAAKQLSYLTQLRPVPSGNKPEDIKATKKEKQEVLSKLPESDRQIVEQYEKSVKDLPLPNFSQA